LTLGKKTLLRTISAYIGFNLRECELSFKAYTLA